LSQREKAILIKWIKDRRWYQPHWASVAPKKGKVPRVKQSDWVKNPSTISSPKSWKKKNFLPRPRHPKIILLRRLSLDLTGLPPTTAEINAFLKDKSPECLENK